MRLKTKVAVLFLIVGLVPLLLGSIFNLWYSAQEVRSVIINQLYSINGIKKEQVETYFEERYADIEVLAASEHIKTSMQAFTEGYKEGLTSATYQSELTNSEPYLKKYVETYGYHDLYLINLQGDVVFTVAKEDDLGINLNDEKYKVLPLYSNDTKNKITYQYILKQICYYYFCVE